MKRHLTGEFEKKYLRAFGERARERRARARRDDGCDSRGDAGAVCAVFVVLIFFLFSCRRDGTRAGGSFRDSAGRRRRATDERVLT